MVRGSESAGGDGAAISYRLDPKCMWDMLLHKLALARNHPCDHPLRVG